MKVLKFEAAWCGPCKALTAVLSGMEGKISVPIEKVDIDEQPDLAIQYGVRGVPTMILIGDDGKELKRKVGAMREAEILKFVE